MEEILKKFDLIPADLVMILVGAVLFVIFWRAFGKGVIEPFAKLVAAREAATVGADKSADDMLRAAQAITEQYENKLTEERVRLLKIKFDAVAEAKATSAKVVADAEAKAQEMVKNARAEIQTQLHTLRQQALRETEGLAQTMAEKAKSAFLVQ